MYIPKEFQQPDQATAIEYMKTYSFATLITASDNTPRATHLPFVIEVENENIILHSHMAKDNPQWEEFAKGSCLVVFSNPNAYISPSLYEKNDNVPTWNYVAVHASGKAVIMDSEAEKIELLERMIQTYEPEYLEQWKTVSERYKSNLFPDLVAFKIHVTQLECKEKLSQNRSKKERENITHSLLESQNELGSIMQKKDNP
jgi:transcriptional regulator